MIELEHVAKTFGTGDRQVRALDDVSLSIGADEYVAIRGHSGSGKSTLLSMISGLGVPTSGRVRVGDVEVSSLSGGPRAAWRRKNVGFVFQMFHLLPYLNIVENVRLGAEDGSAAQAAEATELLKSFGLADRLRHRPGQLSAGERQRVAMARALLNRPSLLLADEPTGNLDPKNADMLLDLIDQFHQQGNAVILVTHSEQAAGRAQRTLEMKSGAIVESKPVKPVSA